MANLRQLSSSQRLKRRVCLWAGSYKYPDGYVEMDFEVAAGITPEDSLSLREMKLARYAVRRRSSRRVAGALFTGLSMFLFARYLHASLWEAIAIAGPMALGLHALTTPAT